jgi:hypothetical protein
LFGQHLPIIFLVASLPGGVMQTSDPAFFHDLELKAALYGLALVPCDLARPAVSTTPSGFPILFLPHAFEAKAWAHLVDEQINAIKSKRGAA